MNNYLAEFFARCPVNGARVQYRWSLRIQTVVRVEEINDVLDSIRSGFHEDIADKLALRFGGTQVMTAEHHGVTIKTTRPTEDYDK